MDRAALRRRLVLAAAALAAAPIVVLAGAAVTTAHRTDLKCFWTGAQLFARGLDPYDGAVWAAAIAGEFENMLGRLGPSPCPGAFAYPLTTSVVMLPLAWLPIEVAAAAWALLGIAGLATGVVWLAHSAGLGRAGAFGLGAIVFASHPAWWNSIFLQYGGILVAGLGLLAIPSTLRSGARMAVGVVLLTTKPHVAPLVLLEKFAAAAPEARWRVLGVLGAIAAVSLAADPSWPLRWVSALIAHRPEVAQASATPWALVNAVTGRADVAFVACLVALTLFGLALRGVPLESGLDRSAVAACAWTLILPYMSGQDLLALVVVWAALLRRGLVALAVAVAVAVPWIAVRLDPGVGLGVVVPITAAVLAVALRWRYPFTPT